MLLEIGELLLANPIAGEMTRPSLGVRQRCENRLELEGHRLLLARPDLEKAFVPGIRPGIGEGAEYKYEILTSAGEVLPLKADPVGFGSQHPPETASVVRDIRGYGWKDGSFDFTSEESVDCLVCHDQTFDEGTLLGTYVKAPTTAGLPANTAEELNLVAQSVAMGQPTIRNCIFAENAADRGGGVGCIHGS